jgi:hypothetical protein
MDYVQWVKDHAKQIAIVVIVVVAGVVIYVNRSKIADWFKDKFSGEGY